MASGIVTYPISIRLTDFLATPISDGTWGDVLQTVKIDLGAPTPATQVNEYAGALYGNVVDDIWLTAYTALNRANKIWQVADAAARDLLGSNEELLVNDLLFKVDDKSLWYCTAVLGPASSTWAITGSSEDLAATLVLGNVTGGTSLVISDGDKILGVATAGVGSTVQTVAGPGQPGFAGGDISLFAGTAGTGSDGGNIIAVATDADAAAGIGGSVNIFGGSTTGAGTGGNIVLTPGTTLGGTDGNVQVTTTLSVAGDTYVGNDLTVVGMIL